MSIILFHQFHPLPYFRVVEIKEQHQLTVELDQLSDGPIPQSLIPTPGFEKMLCEQGAFELCAFRVSWIFDPIDGVLILGEGRPRIRFVFGLTRSWIDSQLFKAVYAGTLKETDLFHNVSAGSI